MAKDLEGRLILISGDSADSRELRDNLFSKFSEDHQIGSRIVKLDAEWHPYDNGPANFHLVDPYLRYGIDDIIDLIRGGDTYFVTKLENPFLKDPLKHLLPPLADKLGSHYSLLHSRVDLDDSQRKDMFESFVANRISKTLAGVVDKDLFDNELIPISKEVAEICSKFHSELTEVLKSGTVDDPGLRIWQHALSGFLSTKLKPRNYQVFRDELQAVSYRIGRELLEHSPVGRFSWVIPFLDGRSDHNKKNPEECVRVKEDADLAERCRVNTLYMIRAHSPQQLSYFQERGINVVNLTLTNEIISLLRQDTNIDFGKCYVLSPDEGGLSDAMVFARELYRRTQGEFTGRTVVFRKERGRPGEIRKMDFLASYMYQPVLEKPEDNIDDRSKRPYDIIYTSTFKDSGHDNYIGLLFRDEALGIEALAAQMPGHTGIIRDDVSGTGGTGNQASRLAASYFGGPIIQAVEHPSWVKNAVDGLQTLFKEGILYEFITSKSVKHPNPGDRPWHIARGMSTRFQRIIKRNFMPWLEQNYKDQYERLLKNTY